MADGIRWKSTITSFAVLASALALVLAPAFAADDDRDCCATQAVSKFEVGYGRNDLFLENRSSRLKLNARVVRKWGAADVATVFAHIAVDVDVDGGNGSDSIQTYLGFALPLSGKAD